MKPEEPNINMQTIAMHTAAMTGNIGVVKKILQSGFPVDQLDEDKATSLSKAILKGHANMAKLLLDNGANPLNADKNDYTPLHLAAYFGNNLIIRYLLDSIKLRAKSGLDADIDKIDIEGRTPLARTLVKGHHETFRLLAAAGANPDATKYYLNRTLLHCMANSGDDKFVSLLLDAGANPNSLSSLKSSPLHEAAMNRHPKCVSLLVRSGADIDCKDAKGLSPLMHAMVNNQNDLPNLENPSWQRPSAKHECVRILLDAGAAQSPDIYTRKDIDPETIKVLVRHPSFSSGLGQTNSDPFILTFVAAAKIGSNPIIEFMLTKEGIRIDAPDNTGRNALLKAVSHGHHSTVELLLNAGASINAFCTLSLPEMVQVDSILFDAPTDTARHSLHNVTKTPLNFAYSFLRVTINPLIAAIDQDHLDIVKLLLQKGADIEVLHTYYPVLTIKNKTTDQIETNTDYLPALYMTPLLRAACLGRANIVDLLLRNGAKTDIADKRALSPLCLAAMNGHNDTAALLLKTSTLSRLIADYLSQVRSRKATKDRLNQRDLAEKADDCDPSDLMSLSILNKLHIYNTKLNLPSPTSVQHPHNRGMLKFLDEYGEYLLKSTPMADREAILTQLFQAKIYPIFDKLLSLQSTLSRRGPALPGSFLIHLNDENQNILHHIAHAFPDAHACELITQLGSDSPEMSLALSQADSKDYLPIYYAVAQKKTKLAVAMLQKAPESWLKLITSYPILANQSIAKTTYKELIKAAAATYLGEEPNVQRVIKILETNNLRSRYTPQVFQNEAQKSSDLSEAKLRHFVLSQFKTTATGSELTELACADLPLPADDIAIQPLISAALDQADNHQKLALLSFLQEWKTAYLSLANHPVGSPIDSDDYAAIFDGLKNKVKTSPGKRWNQLLQPHYDYNRLYTATVPQLESITQDDDAILAQYLEVMGSLRDLFYQKAYNLPHRQLLSSLEELYAQYKAQAPLIGAKVCSELSLALSRESLRSLCHSYPDCVQGLLLRPNEKKTIKAQMVNHPDPASRSLKPFKADQGEYRLIQADAYVQKCIIQCLLDREEPLLTLTENADDASIYPQINVTVADLSDEQIGMLDDANQELRYSTLISAKNFPKQLRPQGIAAQLLDLHDGLYPNDTKALAPLLGEYTHACIKKLQQGYKVPVLQDIDGLSTWIAGQPMTDPQTIAALKSLLLWSSTHPAPVMSATSNQSSKSPQPVTTKTKTRGKPSPTPDAAASPNTSPGASRSSTDSTVTANSSSDNSDNDDDNSLANTRQAAALVGGSSLFIADGDQPALQPTAQTADSLQELEIIAHSLPQKIISTRRFIEESTGCLPAAADASAEKQDQLVFCAVLEGYLDQIYHSYSQYIEINPINTAAVDTTKLAQLHMNTAKLLSEFQQLQTGAYHDHTIQTYYLSAIGADIEYLIRDLLKLSQSKSYTKAEKTAAVTSDPTTIKPDHRLSSHQFYSSDNPLWLALKCDIQALRSSSFDQSNPNWAKFIGHIYRQVRSLRSSQTAAPSQLLESLQHDFYAQANSLLYYLDFIECNDKKTTVSAVVQNTLGRYNSSRHQRQLSSHHQDRYQRNTAILETALTASTLDDQLTPVDALFLAFALHDLQKAYLLANNLKLSTLIANYAGPCRAIKIIKKLRNAFAHNEGSLNSEIISVDALAAWISQQCVQIDTGEYAENLANNQNPDQQLKGLLRDALLQYSQLVSAATAATAEPRAMRQDLTNSGSANLQPSPYRLSVASGIDAPTPPQSGSSSPIIVDKLSVSPTDPQSSHSSSFSQYQKPTVVASSSTSAASAVTKTVADGLNPTPSGEDSSTGSAVKKSGLSIHAKAWTPGSKYTPPPTGQKK